jgi:hypothetical protein
VIALVVLTGRVVTASVAMPLTFNVPVPSEVVPFRKKVTVPVGAPAPGLTGATVAVSVTLWPKTGVLGEKVTVVVVDACITVTGTTDETLDVKVASPEYAAVIDVVPTASVVRSRVATPLPLSVPEPSEVVPLKNSTVPVGVPAPVVIGATVAVNVTLWPNTGAAGEDVSVVVVVTAGATVTGTADESLEL